MSIVISTNLVLSEVEALSADNPVIGWHDLVETTNIDSTTEDADFPVTNLANPATHLRWKGGVNTGDEYVTITTNFLEEIDYLAVARHNFGSANIVVSVEACTDLGASPPIWTEIVQETMLADDAPVLFRFEPAVYQGVRLRMQPGDELPEAAVMYVGTLLILERSIKIDVGHVPITMARMSKIINGMSESGNFLGRIVINEFNESAADFSWFTPDWYRANFHPFVAASNETPFFFAWNPTEYPTDVGYVWMVNDPRAEVDPVTRRVGVQLKYRGIV
jgi:hypothetical protein